MPSYDPMRKLPEHFNKGGDTQSLVHALDDIPPGEGRVISSRPGQGRGAQEQGRRTSCGFGVVHSTKVAWSPGNNADGTWDRPVDGIDVFRRRMCPSWSGRRTFAIQEIAVNLGARRVNSAAASGVEEDDVCLAVAVESHLLEDSAMPKVAHCSMSACGI